MSYLNLSVNSYTFGFAGDDTLEVTVSSSESDWTATPGNNLVSVEKQGKDVVVIAMLPNETSEYVTSEVIFKAGGIEKKLYIDQRPKSYRGIAKDFQTYTRGAMSRNGKWIAYMTNEHEAWLIDTETGEETALEEPPYPGSSSSHYNGLRCISDDARYIVFDHDGNAITTMTIDGEVHEIKVPDGYKHGNVESMSADGSIWVGHVMKEGAVGYWPCRWINGEPEILDRPEYQIDGVTPTFAGCLARGVCGQPERVLRAAGRLRVSGVLPAGRAHPAQHVWCGHLRARRLREGLGLGYVQSVRFGRLPEVL